MIYSHELPLRQALREVIGLRKYVTVVDEQQKNRLSCDPMPIGGFLQTLLVKVEEILDLIQGSMCPVETILMEEQVSSNIDSLGYDELSHAMISRFKGGSSYIYYCVPSEVYDQVRSAESVGGAFNQLVKGRYLYEQLESSNRDGESVL